MKRLSVKYIAYSAVVAAMYFSLTMLIQPLSYGPVQFRLSEALAMLPFIMPESVLGITVGCLLSNIFSTTFPVYDAIFGTLATFAAGLMTRYIKNKWLAGLPPVLINAVTLPLMWYLAGGDAAYWLNFATILASQTVIIYCVGVPLITLIQKKMPSLVTRGSFRKKDEGHTSES